MGNNGAEQADNNEPDAETLKSPATATIRQYFDLVQGDTSELQLYWEFRKAYSHHKSSLTPDQHVKVALLASQGYSDIAIAKTLEGNKLKSISRNVVRYSKKGTVRAIAAISSLNTRQRIFLDPANPAEGEDIELLQRFRNFRILPDLIEIDPRIQLCMRENPHYHHILMAYSRGKNCADLMNEFLLSPSGDIKNIQYGLDKVMLHRFANGDRREEKNGREFARTILFNNFITHGVDWMGISPVDRIAKAIKIIKLYTPENSDTFMHHIKSFVNNIDLYDQALSINNTRHNHKIPLVLLELSRYVAQMADVIKLTEAILNNSNILVAQESSTINVYFNAAKRFMENILLWDFSDEPFIERFKKKRGEQITLAANLLRNKVAKLQSREP